MKSGGPRVYHPAAFARLEQLKRKKLDSASEKKLKARRKGEATAEKQIAAEGGNSTDGEESDAEQEDEEEQEGAAGIVLLLQNAEALLISDFADRWCILNSCRPIRMEFTGAHDIEQLIPDLPGDFFTGHGAKQVRAEGILPVTAFPLELRTCITDLMTGYELFMSTELLGLDLDSQV